MLKRHDSVCNLILGVVTILGTFMLGMKERLSADLLRRFYRGGAFYHTTCVDGPSNPRCRYKLEMPSSIPRSW